MSARGQALVELAVCMPIVLLLGLGAAGVVEVADAASGLQAATDAAVAAAARAENAGAAATAARARFATIVSAYPLSNASFALSGGAFARGAALTGSATADVELGWEAMSFLPRAVRLHATARAEVEQWRSR